MGDKFTYRQADGSNNVSPSSAQRNLRLTVEKNIMFPHLGAANTPYARSVFPGTLQPGALPDPGMIFDSVFARTEFTPHPNNVSSVLFYWASLIIHGQNCPPSMLVQCLSAKCLAQIFFRPITRTSTCLKRPHTSISPHYMETLRKIKTKSVHSRTGSSNPTVSRNSVC